MLTVEIRVSIAGSNWNPFMSSFKATLISRFPLSMLPSRPFRCSQRHQTHLHFLAGVITKDKTVLKGSKFTGVFAFAKENSQSLWNAAPWFQPGVKFTPEDSVIAYSIPLRVLSSFPSHLLLGITEGHGLTWGRNSALELQIRCLVNSPSLPGQAGCTFYKYLLLGNSLGVQCLGFCASNAGDGGSVPGWRTKILYAELCGQKIKNKNKHKNPSFSKVGYTAACLAEDRTCDSL